MAAVSPLPLRAVLFDLDGTLLETRIDFPAMTCAILALAHQAQVPDETVAGRDILGMTDAAADNIAARGGNGAAWRQRAFRQLEDMEREGCTNPALLPGATEMLTELAARGVKIGIVTRNCRTVSQTMLAQFDLTHDVLLTRDDVPKAKPHPEHLWDALRALDCAPDAAAMVGDHWMDVAAGKQAGCAVTIGVRGAHPPDWFAPCPPTLVAADLLETRAFLQTCGRRS